METSSPRLFNFWPRPPFKTLSLNSKRNEYMFAANGHHKIIWLSMELWRPKASWEAVVINMQSKSQNIKWNHGSLTTYWILDVCSSISTKLRSFLKDFVELVDVKLNNYKSLLRTRTALASQTENAVNSLCFEWKVPLHGGASRRPLCSLLGVPIADSPATDKASNFCQFCPTSYFFDTCLT